MNIQQRIDNIDDTVITRNLNDVGYAIAPKVLTEKECDILISEYNNKLLYRKTVIMERQQNGLGQYKYFNYPLPEVVQQLRTGIYPLLVPIANNWMQMLNIDTIFPNTHDNLLDYCQCLNQHKPSPFILRYTISGYHSLHQDIYGEVFFPIQVVVLLSDAGRDYQGGEFVLVEERPRKRSRVVVLKPGLGDLLFFTTNFRPVKDSKGYHCVDVRHCFSEVTKGQHYSLGITFHDAK
jgi:hypothetical protein